MIFTSYFTYGLDPQRMVQVANDSYKYLKPWYDSMLSLGLEGRVFHDSLSSDFISKYETDKIKFVKVPPGKYCACDYRWQAYAKWVNENKPDWLLFTDCCDVVIVQDPFKFIRDPDKLYVGVEDGAGHPSNKIGENRWMGKLFAGAAKKLSASYQAIKNEDVLNCGIVGGHLSQASRFLELMDAMVNDVDPTEDYLNSVKAQVRTIDMACTNVICRNEYFKGRIVSGYPLHNKYKRNDVAMDVYVRHK